VGQSRTLRYVKWYVQAIHGANIGSRMCLADVGVWTAQGNGMCAIGNLRSDYRRVWILACSW
jgi:hypothetical protein